MHFISVCACARACVYVYTYARINIFCSIPNFNSRVLWLHKTRSNYFIHLAKLFSIYSDFFKERVTFFLHTGTSSITFCEAQCSKLKFILVLFMGYAIKTELWTQKYVLWNLCFLHGMITKILARCEILF